MCGQGARQDGQGDEHKHGRTGGIETVVDEAVEQHDADANVSGQAQGAGGAHRTHDERAKPDGAGDARDQPGQSEQADNALLDPHVEKEVVTVLQEPDV